MLATLVVLSFAFLPPQTTNPEPELQVSTRVLARLPYSFERPYERFAFVPDPRVYVDPTQTHVAFIAEQAGKQFVTVDGVKLGPYDSIEDIGEQTSLPVREKFLFNSDGKRYAYVAKRGADTILVVDGKERPTKNEVYHIAFGPDGRFACLMIRYADAADGRRDPAGMRIFIDGVRTPQVDLEYFTKPVFSPNGDHVAYFVEEVSWQDSYLVLDGKAQPFQCEYGTPMIPRFSPDGRHLGYFVYRKGVWRLVIDSRMSPAHNPWYSPKSPEYEFSLQVGRGGRYAYVAPDPRRPSNVEAYCVVIDGMLSRTYEGLPSLRMSPNGERFAYVAIEKEKYFVVVAESEGPQFHYINENVTFSPDSRRIAYVADDAELEFVVLDGIAAKVRGSVDAKSLRFSPDSTKIAYLITKENDDQVVVVQGEHVREYPAEHLWGQATVVFSPDSRHIAYVRDQGERWKIGIDGHSTGRLGSKPFGSAMVFEGNRMVRTVVIRGNEVLQLRISVPSDQEPSAEATKTLRTTSDGRGKPANAAIRQAKETVKR